MHLGSCAQRLRSVIRSQPPLRGTRRSSLRCASERCSGGSHLAIRVPMENRLSWESLTAVGSDRRFEGPSPSNPFTDRCPKERLSIGSRRRLDNLEDFVRIEIATALERGVRVIPVLVDGALMPRSRDIPDDLKTLVRRHALEVRHTRFTDDCGRLIAALERVLQLREEQREKQRLVTEQRWKQRSETEQSEKESLDAVLSRFKKQLGTVLPQEGQKEAKQREKERLEAEHADKERLQAEDFVIGGYIPGSQGFDALLVGVYENRKLTFVAKVKDGFVPRIRDEIFPALKKAERCPLPVPKSAREKGLPVGRGADC